MDKEYRLQFFEIYFRSDRNILGWCTVDMESKV